MRGAARIGHVGEPNLGNNFASVDTFNTVWTATEYGHELCFTEVYVALSLAMRLR